MAVGDEPDFGFLNSDAPSPESPDQFAFTDPADTSPEQSPAPPPEQEQPTAEEPASKQSKLNRPVKKAQTAATIREPEEAVTQKTQTQSETPNSPKAGSVRSKRSGARSPKPETNASDDESSSVGNSQTEGSQSNGSTVPKSQFLALAVFAGLVSILLMLQMLGIISLGGSHQLESVPDVAPLKDGEFQAVPQTAGLPPGHELKLGQAVQFGDVLFTPNKVVREPIAFAQMTSGKAADNMTSQEVLKLYFTIQNKSHQLAFPPWDVALMNHRTPEEGIDPSTKANSWLNVTSGTESQRVLNFFHSPNSNFNIVGMQSRLALQPDESRETFIASSEGVDGWLVKSADLRWRLQLRKGVHQPSQRSVTTFIDVTFAESDIQQL